MAKRSGQQSEQRVWRRKTQTLLKAFEPNDDVSVFIKPDPDSMASAYALKRLLWRKVRNTTLVCISPVERLDNLTMKELLKIPLTQMVDADFLTKVHGVGWIFVSGVYEDKLIVVFRNDGYLKNAGKTAVRAFGDLGSAGGHKGSARAEIPLDTLRENGVRAYSSDLVTLVRNRLKF